MKEKKGDHKEKTGKRRYPEVQNQSRRDWEKGSRQGSAGLLKGACAVLSLVFALSMAACGASGTASGSGAASGESGKGASGDGTAYPATGDASAVPFNPAADAVWVSSNADSSGNSTIDTSSLSKKEKALLSGQGTDLTDTFFTDRDQEQEADTSSAQSITLSDGEDVDIMEEGIYVVSGTASGCTIRVDAGDDAKVQIVLDGVSITNEDAPAIYVVSAKKTFITTTESENTLSVTGTFTADSQTGDDTDAVIFAKDDLTLNGLGSITIDSTDNGISAKDGLKITGGTYDINCDQDAIEGHNSIAVLDGTFTIQSGKDGFHSEDSDDDTKGWIYIAGGTYTIDADDDGMQGTTIMRIDGGTMDISAVEGLESTYVILNGGTIQIDASDDGINASRKSTAFPILAEINGGDITIDMAQGDTDAVDSNGNIVVNGGTVDITAQSAFDCGEGYSRTFNGGTVTVNGEQVTELTGGIPGGGGPGGGPGGGGAPGGGPGGNGR